MPSKRLLFLFIASLGVIIPFMLPYLTLDPGKSRVLITSNNIQYALLIAHIFFAFSALVTGFMQFYDRFRKRKPRFHRYLGRVYFVSVLISGSLALIIIYFIENFTKAAAFLALAIIWLYTTQKGYRTAVQKNFEEHRKWMIRSFGVTLVAVSGRILVPILLLIYYVLNGFTIAAGREKMVEEVLNVNIWAGMIVNIIIVEWIILRPEGSKIKN